MAVKRVRPIKPYTLGQPARLAPALKDVEGTVIWINRIGYGVIGTVTPRDGMDTIIRITPPGAQFDFLAELS